jgi:hypothetical protein
LCTPHSIYLNIIYAVAKPTTPYTTAMCVPRSGARFGIGDEVSVGNIPRRSDGMAVAPLLKTDFASLKTELARESTALAILRILETMSGAGSARTVRALASVNAVVRCGLMMF